MLMLWASGAPATSGGTAPPPSFTCQQEVLAPVVSEDFSDFETDDWVVGGDAFHDGQGDQFFLTTVVPDQGGRLFYGQRQSGCGFRAEFDYNISGGTGADGMTFAVVQDTDYFHGIGGGLDFCPDEGGFAAEFDTYGNGGTDPQGEHVGVIEDCAGNQLASKLRTVRGEHHVVVDFIEGQFNIYIDGDLELAYTFPGITSFDGYIGFTAATGGANDNHSVDNFTLLVTEPVLIQGDLDCDGEVTVFDGLIVLLFLQDLPFDQDSPCPGLTDLVGDFQFADVNCDGVIDANDMAAILAYFAGVSIPPESGCVPLGEPL